MRPPGVRVWVPMTRAEEESRVYIEPSRVNAWTCGAGVGVGAAATATRLLVRLPTTTTFADETREIGVLEIVIAGPPGTSVAVPATKADTELRDQDCPPME